MQDADRNLEGIQKRKIIRQQRAHEVRPTAPDGLGSLCENDTPFVDNFEVGAASLGTDLLRGWRSFYQSLGPTFVPPAPSGPTEEGLGFQTVIPCEFDNLDIQHLVLPCNLEKVGSGSECTFEDGSQSLKLSPNWPGDFVAVCLSVRVLYTTQPCRL